MYVYVHVYMHERMESRPCGGFAFFSLQFCFRTGLRKPLWNTHTKAYLIMTHASASVIFSILAHTHTAQMHCVE